MLELSILLFPQHHAARMAFLDGLNTLPQLSAYSPSQIRRLTEDASAHLQVLVPCLPDDHLSLVHNCATHFQLGAFALPLGPNPPAPLAFNLQAPTTLDNATRVVRAFQVSKPILLEGSPGVGKTSLVTALASMSGHELCRINLSDQTDLIDLFGSDLPVEGGGPGEFAWKDGEFLAALQQGKWVLLDEMNLAPQPVLEGLNAVLDHRGAVYIPELGRSFIKHPNFRIFAAQNPLSQGGGRKGLPKSFVNRFSRVFVQELSSEDMLVVCRHILPTLPSEHLRLMIKFNTDLHHEVTVRRSFGTSGAPWEFNLRDVIRWGYLLTGAPELHPADFLHSVFLCRFRTSQDRQAARSIFDRVFQMDTRFTDTPPRVMMQPSHAQFGHSHLSRARASLTQRPSLVLKQHHSALETLADCVQKSWLSIITGPRNSGKKSLVRALANVGGSPLQEVHISSATDTMDLLGGFEQVDLRETLRSSISGILVDLKEQLRQSRSQWTAAQFAALRQLEACDVHSVDAVSLTTSVTALAEVLPQEKTNAVLANIRATEKGASGTFEWIDGPLTVALKQGHWLLLDGANLCSASVLDRLNSLCEPSGFLTLSERGFVNGHIPVLRPHLAFRLFMTVDPQYGELSRAMRNRGIEVALDRFSDSADFSSLSRYHRTLAFAVQNAHQSIHASANARRGISGETPYETVTTDTGFIPEFVDLSRALYPLSLLPTEANLVLHSALSRITVASFLPIYLRYFRSHGSALPFLHSLPSPDPLVRELYSTFHLGVDETRSLLNQVTPIMFLYRPVCSPPFQSIDVALSNVPRSLGHLLPPYSQLHPILLQLQNLRVGYFDLINGPDVSAGAGKHVSANQTTARILDEIRGLFHEVPGTFETVTRAWENDDTVRTFSIKPGLP